MVDEYDIEDEVDAVDFEGEYFEGVVVVFPDLVFFEDGFFLVCAFLVEFDIFLVMCRIYWVLRLIAIDIFVSVFGGRHWLRGFFFQELLEAVFLALDADVVHQQPDQRDHEQEHHEVGGQQELALVGHRHQVAVLAVGSKILI